jgi:O-antigen/teichoic acid export membrane protein
LSDLKKQGIAALIWDFFGKLSTQGMGFIVTIVLARLLDPSDFGLIAMIMVVVGMAQVFTDIGLGGALIQRKEVSQTHYSSVFYFNIAAAILLTLLTYFSAESIASFYENQRLIPLIETISALFIFSAFGSVQTIKLRKQLKYAHITKAAFVSSILSGVIGITLALYDAGVWSLVAQLLSQSIFNSAILWFIASWRPSLLFSLTALKQLWSFGFRMFLSSLLSAIYTRVDYLIIGKMFPAATLGYFQRAKQFNLLIIQYTSGSLMSVLFPILSQIQDDLPRFQMVILKALHTLCFAVFFLLGGLYLVSEEVIVFLFSEKWLLSVHYMQLLLLSGFSYPLSALLVNILSSRGKSKAFLRLEIIKKLIHSLNFINAIYFGLDSYLYGLVITAFIGVSLNIIFAAKEIRLQVIDFYKPIIIQMALCIFCVYCTLHFANFFALSYLIGFFVKGSLFVGLFTLFNFVFKTDSFKVIFDQLSPFIRTKLRM